MESKFFLNKKTIEAILKKENKTIMVVGDSDTGKTTLIEEILRLLVKRFIIGVVDVDIGQSHIGPPTTIAWGLVKEKFIDWESIPLKDMYFVGTTSPYANLLPTLTGAKFIYDIAKEKVDKVIIDTTGMVKGGAGRVLKICMMDIIHPKIILALEREKELEHILVSFKKMNFPEIFKIPLSDLVNLKSWAERRDYRKRKFRDYFKEAKVLTLSLNKVGLRYGNLKENLESFLVSLRSKEGKDLALGIVEKVQEEEKKISIFTPLKKEEDIGCIIFGNIRINLEGEEL
mgnify:CR=1 FL=1